MRIPDRLKAGPFVYLIERRDYILDRENEERSLFGHIDYATRRIEIATKYGPEQAEASFIHEIIHAIDDLFALGLEERQVDCLAKGFYMILQDNDLVLGDVRTV